ncbi:MAG: hypothetical protein OCC46_02490 [Pseudodesulfovibrio sp.]
MNTNEAKLYQKIMSDKSAQAELMKAGNESERIEIIVRLGEDFALPVTAETVHEFISRDPNEELSDAELEMVVGGKGNPNELIKGDKWSWIGLPDDDLDGGDGNDTIYGYSGNDTLAGGTGNDEVYGGDGNDEVTGGSGNDTVSGGAGNDTVSGDAGNDDMFGGDGDDEMDGGSGNDTLQGGDGNDVMTGGDGNDALKGDEGDDTLTGGAGADYFSFRADDGHDTITDFNPGEDSLNFQGATYDLLNVYTQDGNTIIQYANTTVTLEGVEMDKDAVWNRTDTFNHGH